MEEFKKTFCHCDEHNEETAVPVKKIDAFKKRVSSLIGIRERISSTHKEISVNLEDPETGVHATEFLLKVRKRMPSFGVFLRKFSLPLKTQSLDFNKFQLKNSICSDLKRRYSLFPIKTCNNITKSFPKRRHSLYCAV